MRPIDTMLERADQELMQGNTLSALALLRQVARDAPSNSYAKTRLAGLLIELGKTAEARGLLQGVIKNDASYSPAHLLMGRLLAGEGDAGCAITCFDKAIRYDNGAWGARIEKAQILESLGRRREAALCWTQAIRSMPVHIRESPQMEALVQHAKGLATTNLSLLHDELMDRIKDVVAGERATDLQRFMHALDIVTGRREFITAKPLFLPIPRLPAIPYFEREEFEWAAELETATGSIRGELLNVMGDNAAGFVPYVQTRQGDSSG